MLIGLTGNFGTGKSTVLKMFEKHGATVIDTDEVVKRLYTRNDVKAKVVALLGQKILNDNGEINRSKIANIIFNNRALKDKLENLLHPLVFSEIETLHLRNPDKLVIAEIPLLFESGYDRKVDIIVLTHCDSASIYRRLELKGFSSEDIKKRLDLQITNDRKKHRANYVINTDIGIDRVEEEARMIYNDLIEGKKQTKS